MKEIICNRCKKPIEKKEDLRVGTILFIIYPYHNYCFGEEKKIIFF